MTYRNLFRNRRRYLKGRCPNCGMRLSVYGVNKDGATFRCRWTSCGYFRFVERGSFKWRAHFERSAV